MVNIEDFFQTVYTYGQTRMIKWAIICKILAIIPKVTSEDSGKLAHLCSLVRASAEDKIQNRHVDEVSCQTQGIYSTR